MCARTLEVFEWRPGIFEPYIKEFGECMKTLTLGKEREFGSEFQREVLMGNSMKCKVTRICIKNTTSF